MKTVRCALVALGTVVVSSAAVGAELTKVDGGVMVNRGVGDTQAAPATSLKAGDRVMVNPGSKATLKFADGCTIPVNPGSVVTIGKTSPCAFKAQGIAGIPTTALVIGGAGAALVGIGIYSATKNDDKFVSVP